MQHRLSRLTDLLPLAPKAHPAQLCVQGQGAKIADSLLSARGPYGFQVTAVPLCAPKSCLEGTHTVAAAAFPWPLFLVHAYSVTFLLLQGLRTAVGQLPAQGAQQRGWVRAVSVHTNTPPQPMHHSRAGPEGGAPLLCVCICISAWLTLIENLPNVKPRGRTFVHCPPQALQLPVGLPSS